MVLQIDNVFYLPSGRVFLAKTNDGYPIEFTEMRDVILTGKSNLEVRTTNDPKIIWKHLDAWENKILLTVSTQKGCVHNCKFCDVAPLPFGGNLTKEEITAQIDYLIEALPYVKTTKKAKIGFARMGEPAHNTTNVLDSMIYMKSKYPQFNWLPCFNSILPKKTLDGLTGFDVIDKVIDVKENIFNGFLHFQISCNSTSESIRKELFGGADTLSIEDVVSYINNKKITNRTITLNFIVMKGIPVDVQKLKKLGMTGDKFCVKLIPLNKTDNSNNNNLKAVANYNNFDDLIALGKEFENEGIPTTIDAIAKCEEAGLCCGQLASDGDRYKTCQACFLNLAQTSNT